MPYEYYKVNVVHAIQDGIRLLRVIDKTDKEEGVGDRTTEENEALERLRETLSGYTGAHFE